MKVKLLEDYEQKTAELADFISGISAEMLRFTPPVKDAWSIEEHLRHLLRIELNSFIMYNPELEYISEMLPEISILKDYQQVLIAYHKLRRSVVKALRDKDFIETILNIKSSVHGMLELDIEFTLGALNSHVDTHIEFMERNLKLAANAEQPLTAAFAV